MKVNFNFRHYDITAECTPNEFVTVLNMESESDSQFCVVSFFSGCGGLDLGFRKAGFKIVLANDNCRYAADTYTANHKNVEFVTDDIRNLTAKKLKKILREKGVTKIDVVIGGPPCECFTRLNNNNLKTDDERNKLFKDYLRLVEALKPQIVLMENVPDMLVRKDHEGNCFKDLIYEGFEKMGYSVSHKILEADKYGVPERRKRVFFIASNNGIEPTFPKEKRKRVTVGDALKKIQKAKRLKNHEITENTPKVKRRIKLIPPGGYYKDLPRHLKVKKIRNGKLVVAKRYGSYFRRLKSDEPSITISKNYLIHPTKDRYLTNREKATIHTFPLNYEFVGTRAQVSKMIADSVPPKLAFILAKHIKKMLEHN